MNFATLKGLTIPEGNVTQITDASGRVIWAVSGGKAILQVEKMTCNTYAGETSYTGEQVILLDIYPETNGTVKVTYGGLTKTITDTSGAEEPNARQVFFGTFNGVSDSVTTPASGELVIEGDYYAFGVSSYNTNSKGTTLPCNCITAVVEFGEVSYIPYMAFCRCEKITKLEIPDTVQRVGEFAFFNCVGLLSVSFLTTVPPTLGGEDVFDSTTCHIIVPAGCGVTYKDAEYWSKYADRIVEAS